MIPSESITNNTSFHIRIESTENERNCLRYPFIKSRLLTRVNKYTTSSPMMNMMNTTIPIGYSFLSIITTLKYNRKTYIFPLQSNYKASSKIPLV